MALAQALALQDPLQPHPATTQAAAPYILHAEALALEESLSAPPPSPLALEESMSPLPPSTLAPPSNLVTSPTPGPTISRAAAKAKAKPLEHLPGTAIRATGTSGPCFYETAPAPRAFGVIQMAPGTGTTPHSESEGVSEPWAGDLDFEVHAWRIALSKVLENTAASHTCHGEFKLEILVLVIPGIQPS